MEAHTYNLSNKENQGLKVSLGYKPSRACAHIHNPKPVRWLGSRCFLPSLMSLI